MWYMSFSLPLFENLSRGDEEGAARFGDSFLYSLRPCVSLEPTQEPSSVAVLSFLYSSAYKR
jgi:hypothetical protein